MTDVPVHATLRPPLGSIEIVGEGTPAFLRAANREAMSMTLDVLTTVKRVALVRFPGETRAPDTRTSANTTWFAPCAFSEANKTRHTHSTTR